MAAEPLCRGIRLSDSPKENFRRNTDFAKDADFQLPVSSPPSTKRLLPRLTARHRYRGFHPNLMDILDKGVYSMKKFAFTSMLVLFAISLASPWLASARPAGRTASGSYRFTLDDDLTKAFEFTVSTDERGVTTGH